MHFDFFFLVLAEILLFTFFIIIVYYYYLYIFWNSLGFLSIIFAHSFLALKPAALFLLS